MTAGFPLMSSNLSTTMVLMFFLPLLFAQPPIHVQQRSGILRRMPLFYGKRNSLPPLPSLHQPQPLSISPLQGLLRPSSPRGFRALKEHRVNSPRRSRAGPSTKSFKAFRPEYYSFVSAEVQDQQPSSQRDYTHYSLPVEDSAGKPAANSGGMGARDLMHWLATMRAKLLRRQSAQAYGYSRDVDTDDNDDETTMVKNGMVGQNLGLDVDPRRAAALMKKFRLVLSKPGHASLSPDDQGHTSDDAFEATIDEDEDDSASETEYPSFLTEERPDEW